MSSRWSWPVLLSFLCLAQVPAGDAFAEATRMVAHASGPLGVYAGREYVWVSAEMHGTVARASGKTGRYRVPVVLMYPDRDPSGLGLVDLINSAAFQAVARVLDDPVVLAEHVGDHPRPLHGNVRVTLAAQVVAEDHLAHVIYAALAAGRLPFVVG